jgi:hypothetical protein
MQDSRQPAQRRSSPGAAVLATAFTAMFLAYTLFMPAEMYHRFVSAILGAGAIVCVAGLLLQRNNEQLSANIDALTPPLLTPRQAAIEAVRSVSGRMPLKTTAGVVRSLAVGHGRWLAYPHQLDWVDDGTVDVSTAAALTDWATGVYVYLGTATSSSDGRAVVHIFAFGDIQLTEGVPEGALTARCVFHRMPAYANA